MESINGIDIIILCGGKGTRLQPVVSDRPKALAVFGNSTFIDILIKSLKKTGFNRFILCIGYMKDQIKDHFKNTNDFSITFSEEEVPLGTGGALKKAQSLINSEDFIVMNGDSICEINFKDFYQFHKNSGSLLSIALVPAQDSRDFGSVFMDDRFNITSFKEKVATQNSGLINAGVYFMNKDIFDYMPEIQKFSLENDFFPNMVGKRCKGFIINCELIDIGTPERYEKAGHIIGE